MYADQFREVKTYRDDNQFRFVCPVMGTEESIRDCFNMLEEHKRGKRFAGREGCQACMASSKCPASAIQRHILHADIDPYYSKEPKVGQLWAEHIERVRVVIVRDEHLNVFQVPDEQRSVITEAHQRLMQGKAFKSSLALGNLETLRQEPQKSRRKRAESQDASSAPETPSKPETRSATLQAASTGDLTAAMNLAIAEPELATETPTEPPKLSLIERARLKKAGKL